MVERRAYRAREVAEILGVDINSVYDMVHNGTLPAVRIGETGKRIRIPRKFVDDLLEGRKGDVSSDADTRVMD